MSDEQKTSLTHEQKTGFVLLLIFGVIAVGLGFFQMRNDIYGPFASQLSKAGDSAVVVSEEARLQMIDTDQDGLNDFEEISFYETSRYLPDTDSDGIGDKEEIEQGTNPLCPEGEECQGEEFIIPDDEDEFVSPLAEETVTPLDILATPELISSGSAGTIDPETLLGDADQLRELIKATGQVPDEILDSIDDETLMQMARESMAEQQSIDLGTE